MNEHNQMALFQYKMCERFTKGRKKYKNKYLKRDNLSELQDELIDVANYAMMEWMKIEELKKKVRQ